MKNLTLVIYLHKNGAVVSVVAEAHADAAPSRVPSGPQQ